MFCEECGAEIDDTAKFCDKCGVPTSKSVKDRKQKKEINIKKDNVPDKSSKRKWIILAGIVIVALIICASVMYMEQTSRETTVSGSTVGSYSASLGNTFKIKGDIDHKNMFGDVKIDGETLKVTIKDENGKVVDKKTQNDGEEYEYDDLPLGKYTVEFKYAGGDYPAAKDTKVFTVITKDDVNQRKAQDDKNRQEYWNTYIKMYNAVF